VNSQAKLSNITRNSSKNIKSLSSLLGDERAPKLDILKTSKKLLKKLEDIYESPEYLDVYFDIFDEVISNDRDFGSVLSLLKNRIRSIFKDIKKENDLLQKNLKETSNLRNCLEAEHKRVTMENLQLQSNLEKIHEKFTDLSDKLIKLTKIDLKPGEVTDENFKKLKQENLIYQDLIFKMRDEIKFFKGKSKKLSNLLNVLESKGIPVEDIYLKEVKKVKKLPKYSGDSEIESCSDNENLVSMRQELQMKPVQVPSLGLLNLDRSSSDDSFISSLTPTPSMLEI
jgi:hypothetical protein